MNVKARNAYLANSVATASPERLLVMLCERLVLDLRRGREAQANGDRSEANQQLLHAQEIILELRSSLRKELWSGAEGLDTLYAWMHQQMVRANVSGDTAVTDHVLGLAEQLSATWREAALARIAS